MMDDPGRLQDMLEAIERIEQRAAAGRTAFEEEELLQVWIVHHLQIVGEAARGLSAEFRAGHNEVPWSKIIGMRNILVHDYFGIDLEIVWSVVERDLPDLKKKLQGIAGTDSGTTNGP